MGFAGSGLVLGKGVFIGTKVWSPGVGVANWLVALSSQ
jgi:hypothetical protein